MGDALVTVAGVGVKCAASDRPAASAAAALTASPAATPEKPHFVPVPRLPGPWATIATSAPTACFAARGLNGR